MNLTPPLHLLLICGKDIETNQDPMPNILQAQSPAHKKRNRVYYITCTTKLKPKNYHLAKQISPNIDPTHPEHQSTMTNHPHLARHIYNQQHPTSRILYAINTTNPRTETCDHLLSQTIEPKQNKNEPKNFKQKITLSTFTQTKQTTNNKTKHQTPPQPNISTKTTIKHVEKKKKNKRNPYKTKNTSKTKNIQNTHNNKTYNTTHTTQKIKYHKNPTKNPENTKTKKTKNPKHLKRARPPGLAQNSKKNKTNIIQNHYNITHTNKHSHKPKIKNLPHKTKLKSTKNKKRIKTRNKNIKAKKQNPTKNLTLSFKLLLIRGGDIETNPGPMPNILHAHPPAHKNRSKIYFTECTIKLKPEYYHLAKQFSPNINPTHPEHPSTITKYPHLARYIQQNQHHPPPCILYALITTISPIIETCNHLLIQTPEPDCTTTILERMALLQNPPERHILTTHPYTQFIQTNQNIINPPATIHKDIYNFIKQNEPLNI